MGRISDEGKKWLVTSFFVFTFAALISVPFEGLFPVIDKNILSNVVWNLFGLGFAYLALKGRFNYDKKDIVPGAVSLLGGHSVIFVLCLILTPFVMVYEIHFIESN